MSGKQLDLFGAANAAEGAGVTDAAPRALREEPDSADAAVHAAAEAPLPDAAARARIATDLDTNLLVEAGAGAGKTTAMVTRMVALVRSGRATVDRIAAVTFTRKAAAELRERFQTVLERELIDAAGAREASASLLDAALRDIDRSFIGTIHAFCARLLRERPLDAGLDPGFRETFGAEEPMLRRAFYDRHIERLAAVGDASLSELAAVGLTPRQVFELFERLVENPDITFASAAAPRPDTAPARRAVEALLAEAARYMPAEEPEKGWDPLQLAVRTLRFRRWVLDWSDDTRFLDTLLETLGEAAPKPTQNRWSDDRSIRAAVKRMYEQLIDQCATGGVIGRTIRAWQEHRHPVALEFVSRAAAEFEVERRRAGTLFFGDLLMHAARMLRESESARASVGERYAYLLVDEFQDTDPIQAEVLFLIASDPHDRDWRAETPRPGSLFVVGDPKQSIYRFRRADITLYEEVKARFRAFGDVVELTSNFRSTPPIGTFVNDVFAPLLTGGADPGQAPFAPMRVRRAADAMAGVYWYQLVKPTGPFRYDEMAAQDAERIASWVARRVARGERSPGDFLILTRTRRRLPIYARAIEARNLPVEVTGGGVAIEEELRELRLLLAALADPGDERRTVAALTGLFFGLDYEQLASHVLDGGGRLGFLSSSKPADGSVAAALATLHRMWKLFRTEPADVALGRIVAELGLLPYAAAGELGGSRAGALLYILDAARAAALSGDASIAGIALAIDAAVATDEAEASLEPGRGDVVRVMNLHQAKGLEAPVVILVDPVGERDREPTLHVDRTGDVPRGHAVLSEPKKKGGYGSTVLARPLNWDEYAAREAAFEAAERNRLLYVAATRAADELVVATLDNGSSPWEPFTTYLRLDRPKLELEIEAPPPRTTLAASADEIEAEIAAVEAERARSARPTYHASPITRRVLEIVDRSGIAERERREGAAARASDLVAARHARGVDWGNSVHGALEAAARGLSGRRLSAACRALLIGNERPLDEDGEPRELDELVSIVEAARQAPFWPSAERARAAGTLLVEAPFAVRLEPAEYRAWVAPLGGAAAGASGAAGRAAAGDARAADAAAMQRNALQIVEGVIDLVFRDENGWVLVDYKSDATGAATPAARRARYRAQVALYAAAWERISGEPVMQRVVFYTADGSLDAW